MSLVTVGKELRKRVVILLLFIGLVLPVLVTAATPRNQTGYHPELDVDQWIGGYDWYYVYMNLDDGDIIYVEIEVTSGTGIDFFICDQENYDIWASYGSATGYRSRENVGSISTSYTVSSSGPWYAVFINSDLLTSKRIEGYVGTVNPLLVDFGYLLPFIGIAVAIIIGGAIWSGLKKMQQPKTAQYQSTMSPQRTYATYDSQNATGSCPFCGTPKRASNARYCSTCGRQFDGSEMR